MDAACFQSCLPSIMTIANVTFDKLELSQNHRDVFNLGMKVLEEAYGPPLL